MNCTLSSISQKLSDVSKSLSATPIIARSDEYGGRSFIDNKYITKFIPVIKKERKKRTLSYRYSNQSDLKSYLKEKPKDQYDSVDIVNYFHLWQISLSAPMHYPHYKSECRFAKLLVKEFGVMKTLGIIDSYFSNRKEFESSDYKLNNPHKCTFRVLNLSSNKKVIYKCLEKIKNA